MVEAACVAPRAIRLVYAKGVSMPDVKKVASVAEYVAYIDRARTSLRNSIETCECTLVFRGQGSSSYELLPSIARDCFCKDPATGKRKPITGSLCHEANLVEDACRILPRVFDRCMQPIDLLACLQHYGIPTRLLDVTSNALSALYFACGDVATERGALISATKLRQPRLSSLAGNCGLLAVIYDV